MHSPRAMRLVTVLALVATLGGCGRGGGEDSASAARGELTRPVRWEPAPAWAHSAAVLAEQGSWTLVRAEAEAPPHGTDVRVPVRMAVVRDDGAALLPPGPVVEGALVRGWVAWVGVDGALWVDDGADARRVDDRVAGELAVAPSAATLAYAKHPGADAGVWLLSTDNPEPRRVTRGLAVADRPLFVAERHLVVVGARPGGVAGVWTVRLDDADAQPRPVTNADLRAGKPLGPSFVPPPAAHDSMRMEGTDLVYDDGRSERRVPLAEELR